MEDCVESKTGYMLSGVITIQITHSVQVCRLDGGIQCKISISLHFETF